MAIHCQTAEYSISKIWPNLRQENRQQGTTKVWWRALQWCWWCPLSFHIHIQWQNINIQEREWCMPLRYGHTLSDSWFDFENLTQSEARVPPMSDHKSVIEGPTMVLMVSIVLSYTYTWQTINIQEREWCMPLRYGYTLSGRCHFNFENLPQSEAREPPTSGHRSVMEGPTMVLMVSIVLSYTYTWQTINIQEREWCMPLRYGYTLSGRCHFNLK